MSIVKQIADLEVLVEVDGAIKVLADKLKVERSDIEVVRTEMAELEVALATDREAVIEMEKTRQDLLLELRQNDQQVERSRDRLNRARNEREQNAAERELDELRKLHRDRDDEVKKVTALADQAKTTIADNEARHAELTARLAGVLPGATETIATLEAKLAALQERRVAAAAALPSLTRRRYQGKYDRGKTPVAHTTDGTCQGCYVQLPPMLFHTMLSQQRFEECPFCHRILYYRAPPTAEELAAAEAAASEAAEAADDDEAKADASDDAPANESST